MANAKKAPAKRQGRTKKDYVEAGAQIRAQQAEEAAPKRRAALYIRVSTHHQLDRDSLPYQRQELTNYAKYVLGIDDIEIFEDAGYSGKNVDRPAYQRMMKGVRVGYFTHILVWKIDRISRNLMDFTKMYEELKKYNVTFISKNEQFDTSSAMGEAMLKIILVFAELERQLTAERVTAIMYSRAEKGLWNGAPIPIGYMWSEESKYPVINPDEASTVRLIYDKYEQLQSTSQVRDYLNKNMIRTKRGNEWNTTTVTKVLRNPFYKGTYRYNYRTTTGTLKPLSEQIVHHDNHDAIITKEQWQKCNDIMDRNAKRDTSELSPRRVKNVHIFSNLLKCGECGETMGAGLDKQRSDGYAPSKYRCTSHMKRTGCQNRLVTDVTLGPFVFNYISNMLTARKKIAEGKLVEEDLEKALLRGNVFADVDKIEQAGLDATYGALKYDQPDGEGEESNSGELEELQQEKAKYERAFERLQSLYLFADDSMSEKDYLVKKKDIEDHIDAINERISNLYEQSKEFAGPRSMDYLQNAGYFYLTAEVTRDRRYILDFRKLVTTFDRPLLKDFLNTVLRKIVVQDGLVQSITFKNGLTHRFIYK